MKFFQNDGIGPVRGLLSIDHLIFTLVGISLIVLFLILTRHFDQIKIKKTIRILFWIVFILEILKIVWNLTIRENAGLNQWVPLYFCSLLIPALGLAGYGNKFLEKLGLSFMFYGGIVAGAMFVIWPTSALPEQPLLHCLTFHTLFYHSASVAIGLLIVIRGYFTPVIKDIIPYSIIVVTFCIIAYIFNLITGSNLMFISNDNGMFPLTLATTIFGVLYPLGITIVQTFGTFFATFYIYKLICLIHNGKGNKSL
ncbi:MAG: YwaF family protein [Bacilli bacterium]|nr:YwaF family protein [Bacilli bacterium]